jgi:hypothetical protein
MYSISYMAGLEPQKKTSHGTVKFSWKDSAQLDSEALGRRSLLNTIMMFGYREMWEIS